MYNVYRFLSKILMKLLYRVEIINSNNIPKKGKIVICGNHTSVLDAPLVLGSTKRKLNFLAKIELSKGFKGIFFKPVDLIYVDRSRKAPEVITESVRRLNEEQAVVIFPEGTTKKPKGTLLEFKIGTVKIADLSNSELLPFAIVNDYKLFRKSVKLIYGKPYKLESDDLEYENNKLREKVIELIKENQCK